ncbi:hypothetical protein TUM19329_37040 (plasmid) [Legionella antarctica]|uniref:Uncharacterized protein n=1 Tax=Legionella antarctica TaxID=2708020 RepID=A0A6F8TAT0_9GAMM|nr:hypothetical protein [Legionella antarctica]BCA97343.1 hypothetical protein TUM19329_37040 [Legionella antarctica]
MNDVVDYDQLVAFLKNASLFEIYRLSVALSNELENPLRISALINKFKEGDVIEYFDATTQSFITARVLQKALKNAVVQRLDDGRQWKIPYHMLKIDSREFIFEKKERGLNKNSIKVGDYVGFSREGEEIIGCVERLNQKTVTIVTSSQHRWRVAYQLLYEIIEGESVHSITYLNISQTK